MRLVEKTRIYFPNDWGATGIFVAFSFDGQLIAVRVPTDNRNYEVKRDNLFVYDINGNQKWSGYSLDGGSFNEWGIAFYPNKYNLLAPGADDTCGNLDGLKQYTIGDNGYSLPFANTALNGINTSIYDASDKGETILGRKNGLFCINKNNQLPIKDEYFSEAYFSPDAKYLAFINFLKYSSWFYKLSEYDKKIELSGQFVCFLPQQKLLEYDKNYFKVWDIERWQVLHQVKTNLIEHHVFSGTSTQNGDLFVMCDLLGEISLWEFASFTQLYKVNLPSENTISRMKFSFDNQYLLSVVMAERKRKEVVIWLVEY